MKREYQIRGRRVEVEELENLAAVKPLPGAQLDADATPAFGETIAAPGVRDEAVGQAFQAAGWEFVRPSAEVRESMESLSAPAGAATVQRVFEHPSGRILLGLDRLSVKLRPDLSEVDARSVLNSHGLEVVEQLTFAPNLFVVQVSPGRDFLQASLELSEHPDFLAAEPLFIENIPQRFSPSDPEYGQQWHLKNTGQNGGTPGADIHAEDAWDTTRGGGIKLAVIDNGFDVSHPDLAAAISSTSAFYRSAANPTDPAQFVQSLAGYPDANHGTFCAGMASARAENANSGCGVANEADLTLIACLTDQIGTQVTLARAVAYAADPSREIPGADSATGVDVIACSLGPNNAPWEMTTVLQDAIDFAVSNGRGGLGTPIFWATDNGNVPVSQDEVVSYENTIAVGRSTRDDVEDNSAFGPELDFLATGVDVANTESGGGFGTSTGTSFAAPTAAGVGALVLAVNPALTWTDVRQLMRDTCDKIGGVVYDANGHNVDYGYGRVNAATAVSQASLTTAGAVSASVG